MTRPAASDGSATRHPRALRTYVALLALAAAATLAVEAQRSGVTFEGRWASAALLLVLLVEAHLLRVRYDFRQHHDDLNFFESGLAVSFLAFGGADVAALAATATACAMLVQRVRDVRKVVFNVAQWTLAAAAGSAVHTALRGPGGTGREITAVLAGVLTAMVVNQAAIMLVLWLASGTPAGYAFQGLGRVLLKGRLVASFASLSLGLVLAGAFAWDPAVLPFAFLPLGMLHWASKGYAAARADRARLLGLQRATHTLSVHLEPAVALPLFLTEVRQSFEVRVVELVLLDDTGGSVHVVGEDDVYQQQQLESGPRLSVLEQLAIDLPTPVRAVSGQAAGVLGEVLEANGWRNCLAAPLRSGGRSAGLLLLSDRIGMEGFEGGELVVTAALAAETVGFLQRARLTEKLLEERGKLSQIVDSTSDGILMLAADGRVTSWNAGMETITGYAAAELVGTRHLALLRARDGRGHDVMLERWARSGVEELPTDIQVMTADGTPVWLSCSYSPVAAGDGGQPALVVVARNVTQARELERLKDDFVAVVSHELRTPLSPIKGWAATLLSRGHQMSEDQRQDGLLAIHRQAQRLEQLVLNILEASRIEAGRPDRTPEVVDVGAVALKVVDELGTTRPDRTVRVLGADAPHAAHGHPVWVERALANLVSNALKYSPDTQPVDIRIESVGGSVVVSVTDQGPGIRPEDHERVFGRFERLRESQTQTGTGLGLYITRQLARAMGGTVTLTSLPGAGSTFALRLRSADLRVPGQAPAPDLRSVHR